MKKRRLAILTIGIFFIVIPNLINVYSIYKLISLCLGIILVDISLALKNKISILLLIYLPIILMIFTYALDYIKVYTLNISPVYVFENKINDEISVYNSLFYRVFKCSDKFIFDNNYEDSFPCDTAYLKEQSIGSILSDPLETYKTYKNDFIKIKGKISKIIGTSSIFLESYQEAESDINGYVKFDKNSHVKIELSGEDTSKYRIYDYITVVGLLKSYDKENNELIFTNIKIEDNNLYKDYTIHIIENNEKELKEYLDNFYTYKLENIYLDYNVDKFELSYAIKDKRITFEEFTKNASLTYYKENKIYELEKLNIIECRSDNKKIFTSSTTKPDKIIDSFCQIEE